MIRLTTQSDSEEGAVRYFLVQHVPDALRRETCNVGVVVEKGRERTARFLGQDTLGGSVDLRAARRVADAKVYRMWVRHWERAVLADNWKERMAVSGKSSYALVPAGEVTQTGSDSAEDICRFLYSTLVSAGGLSEALADTETDEHGEIRADIRGELRRLEIMASNRAWWCRNPVFADYYAHGRESAHRVGFFQESGGERWAIEGINMSSHLRVRTRERAGYLNYVFGDLRATDDHGKTNTLALVTYREEDRSSDVVRYAMDAVSRSATVVNWGVYDERQAFLKERERIARAVA